MANEFKIRVVNNSGSHQTYAIFNKPPVVAEKVGSEVFTNVFQTALTPSGNSAAFEIYLTYYAFCGTAKGSVSEGSRVTVDKNQMVKLGYKTPNGQTVYGSQVLLEAVDGKALTFGEELDPAGFPNAFAIKTQNDFTAQDANAFNFSLGLALGSGDGGAAAPAATFIPEPKVTYQIEPVNTWYLSFGEFKSSTLYSSTKLGDMLAIDFTKMSSPEVFVVHHPNGDLIVQVKGKQEVEESLKREAENGKSS